MPRPIEQIQSEENFQRISAGIEAADQAQEVIDLAKQAGLPVDEQDRRNKETKAQLLKLKNTFFPGR